MAEDFNIINETLTWFKNTNIQASLIGVLAIIINNRFKSCSDKKKQISCLIDDIEMKSIKHWCSDPSENENHARAIEIQSLIGKLGKLINHKKPLISSKHSEFRQHITGGEFSEPNRKSISFEDPLISLISKTSDELKDLVK